MSPHAKRVLKSMPNIADWMDRCLRRPLSPLSMPQPRVAKGASRTPVLPFVEEAFAKRYGAIGHLDLGGGAVAKL